MRNIGRENKKKIKLKKRKSRRDVCHGIRTRYRSRFYEFTRTINSRADFRVITLHFARRSKASLRICVHLNLTLFARRAMSMKRVRFN